MYFIEIPPMENGIYAILNYEKERAYIGLAKNLRNRTREHFLAICNEDSQNYSDNKNLIDEKEKRFIHFWIYKNEEILASKELDNLETLFMIIARDDLGFTLYNDRKKEYQKEDIDFSNDFLQANSCETIESLRIIMGLEFIRRIYEFTSKPVSDSIETLLKKTSISNEDKYSVLCQCIRERKRNLLKEAKKVLDFKENFFVLTKKEGSFYSDCNNMYNNIKSILAGFSLSKDVFKDPLFEKWKEYSLLDEKFGFDKGREFIISKFGSHNGESAYEILYKMAIDISNVNYCLWSLKNLVVEKVRELAKRKEPLYAILVTTPSDNSKKYERGEKPKQEEILPLSNIQEKHDKQYENNPQDLMHSYLDENSVWRPISNKLSYVTSPDGKKTVAFKIKNFFICKEYFDFNVDFKELLNIEAYNNNPGSLTAFFASFKKEAVETIRKWDESEESRCIIAELEYPYVFEVSHTPALKDYLSRKENGKLAYRIFLETNSKRIGINAPVNRMFAFKGDKVYFCECNKTTYRDLTDISNEDLYEKIKKVSKSYSYRVEIPKEDYYYETIIIDAENEIRLNFNIQYNSKEEKNWKRIQSDNYMYYGVMTSEDELIVNRYKCYKKGLSHCINNNGEYVEDYEVYKDTGRPPYVFDEDQ